MLQPKMQTGSSLAENPSCYVIVLVFSLAHKLPLLAGRKVAWEPMIRSPITSSCKCRRNVGPATRVLSQCVMRQQIFALAFMQPDPSLRCLPQHFSPKSARPSQSVGGEAETMERHVPQLGQANDLRNWYLVRQLPDL